MNPPIPPDALDKAQPAVDKLQQHLEALFPMIEPGSNSAIRFSAEENQ